MIRYSKIKSDLGYFLKSIENYNETPFNKKIQGENISVGFVYKELCEDFNCSIIHNIEKCFAAESKNKEGKTFKGWFYLWMGKGFRDNKRTLSESFSDQAIYGIDMMRDELYRIMKKMEKLSIEIDTKERNSVLVLKTKHSTFGYLNALEWYDLGMNNLKMYKKLKIQLDKKINA